jgi:hypothetical protein
VHIPTALSIGHKFGRCDGALNVFGLADIISVFGEHMESAILGAMLANSWDIPDVVDQ